jgi:hypothetical protein
MIIKGSCRDFRIIEKSSRDPLMFNSNIVRGMRLKHTWSLTFYNGRFLNFKIYLWTWDSPKLVKCGILDIFLTSLMGLFDSFNRLFGPPLEFFDKIQPYSSWASNKWKHMSHIRGLPTIIHPKFRTLLYWIIKS